MKDLIPKKMHGVLLTGHGGIEKLEYLSNVKVPIPKDNEVFEIDKIISIKILKANERKILTVQIRKLDN